jgi:hypothetical protein
LADRLIPVTSIAGSPSVSKPPASLTREQSKPYTIRNVMQRKE